MHVMKGKMDVYKILLGIFCLISFCQSMSKEEKSTLKNQAVEMFHHAFKHYMDYAYPADELMPLSCKGRYRGTEPSRGDIDDVLGNYSLSLIDALDTLVILGEIDLFEDSVSKIIRDVNFDNDIVVSVFEANIRVIGGLLGGHLMADHVSKKMNRMTWYRGELLKLAKEVGDRLLPAFNTSTGMPYPRVNLKYGVKHEMSRTGHEKDTCTACAGTMILEFSALSRLTGHKIYEEKAQRAMDYLWKSRHSMSDLVGTVINIQNGDWVRKESGVGAGIDSYYEYLLKAYIMLGDDIYLDRFNTHYKAVMKYINNGPLMLDVHMHRPQTTARNFMDSLLAFWPGLQVLKGDLKPAIEIHEMLYQVMLRHNFLPEAFTSDFRVHWGQHPLRPEFLESTYFIFKATGDHHYLEVGKKVLENLNKIARVKCGFAAIKDVTTGDHEDQMDSFVFAETFKYLFLLFSEKEDLTIDVDDFVFTTEAHLLPLFLSMHGQNKTDDIPSHILQSLKEEEGDDDEEFSNTCPSASHLFKGTINYAQDLRNPLKNMVERLCPRPVQRAGSGLRAVDFIAGNKEQMEHLNQMGIRLITMNDGRVQLVHISSEAISPEASHDGMLFMQEMIELSKSQSKEVPLEPRVVQLLSPPMMGSVVLRAGPAQFGLNLKNHKGVEGQMVKAHPYDGCSPLTNKLEAQSKIIVVGRGGCMFIEKVRNIQEVGGVAGIVCDNNSESSSSSSQHFSMSGDGKTDVKIPAVFLFFAEAKILNDALASTPDLVAYIGEDRRKPEEMMERFADAERIAGSSAEVLTEAADDDSDTNKEPVGGSSQKGLNYVLDHLGLQALAPLVKQRGLDISHEGLPDEPQTDFFKHKLRSSNDDEAGNAGFSGDEEKAEKQFDASDSKEAANIIIRREDGHTGWMRAMYGELMFLLKKCTNFDILLLDSEFENDKVLKILENLIERAYLPIDIKFEVDTESVLRKLKGRLSINNDDDQCFHNQYAELLRQNSADRETMITNGFEDNQDKMIFSVAKNLDIDVKELDGILDEFVEQQVTDLFKQLWIATSGDDENTFELQGSTTSSKEPASEKEDETSHACASLAVDSSQDVLLLTKDSKEVENVISSVTDATTRSYATITCSQDGCIEISIKERHSVLEVEATLDGQQSGPENEVEMKEDKMRLSSENSHDRPEDELPRFADEDRVDHHPTNVPHSTRPSQATTSVSTSTEDSHLDAT